MVRQVLELGVLRGNVRVALWRALAQVPGIVTTPGKAAPDGRVGIGFTADGDGGTIIADPESAQLIGYTLPHKSSIKPKATTTTSPSSTTGSSTMTTQAAPEPTGSPQNELETIYQYSWTQTDR